MVRKELYNVYETSSFPMFSQILALISFQNNSRLYPDISTSQRAIKAMYLCVCVQQMRTFSLFMRLKLTGLVLFIPFSI